MNKPNKITIGSQAIGEGHPPFIIAEMSGNHNQSLDKALEIVEAVAQSGCHALKIQTYTADTLTIDSKNDNFIVSAKGSPWEGQSLYELYKQAYTPWEWHKAIFDRCQELGLIAFSSPFDETAVDFLEELNVPAYKIASFENCHLPLIKKVAQTKKPLIISTGMATKEELEETVSVVRQAGGEQLILLKCTSTYPASPTDSNLMTIPDLKSHFDVEVGLSDHTLGMGVSVASIALGATVIEKHFTLSREEGGVDASFSMEPSEMKELVQETHKAWEALGKVSYGPTDNEKPSIRFRRSIYAVEDIQEGDSLTAENIRIIRPGEGLAPKHYEEVLGRKAVKTIQRGTPLNWDYIN